MKKQYFSFQQKNRKIIQNQKMQIPLKVHEGTKKFLYREFKRNFFFMQCHHQTHLAEKRFFLSLYIEGEESFLDKRIFLGLLERNESPLIIKKTFKHPLEFQQKFESQLF